MDTHTDDPLRHGKRGMGRFGKGDDCGWRLCGQSNCAATNSRMEDNAGHCEDFTNAPMRKSC